MSDKAGKHLFESQKKKDFRARSSLVHWAAQTVPTLTRMLKSLSRWRMLYSTALKKETLWKSSVWGWSERTAFQRRVSSAEHDPVFLSVGRYNHSVSVSLTMWWTHVAVNYKSLYCLRLCSVEKWMSGNINEKAVTFSKTTQSPESLSYTNTAQI